MFINESSFLGGEVLKRTLTVVHGRPGPEAPRLKRLFLTQGELAHVYDGTEGIRYLAYVELRGDEVRGNHYHEVKEETIYVIQGEMKLVVEDIETKERTEMNLVAGELVTIPVRIAHAFQTISKGLALEWSQVRFDAADSYACPLIR